MVKVEGDLEKSKNLREEQIKSSNQQIEELKNSHRKKVDNIYNEFEKEKQRLKHDFEADKQKLIKSHEKELDDTHNKLHIQIMEINQASKTKCEHLTSVKELSTFFV